MRRGLGFLVGVLVGQWLAFGGQPSLADLHMLGTRALEQRDYADAVRLWSQAVSLQPGNARFHYLRGAALAGLGHAQSAADAYQLALVLEPTSEVADLARQGLSRLGEAVVEAPPGETIVPLEGARGVWTVQAWVNGALEVRLLLDTGASVTVVHPAVAEALGVRSRGHETIELQTLSGRSSGPAATVASLRVGEAEVRDVPVVVHDPGPGLDGILGNSFLARYRVTLDPDRQRLHLRPLAAD